MSADEGPLGFGPGPEDPAAEVARRAAAGEESPAPSRPPLGPTSRYAWIVGVVAVLAVGWLVVGASRPPGPGATGLPAGSRLPPFAAVLATSPVVCASERDACDTNVARAAGQGRAGNRPACEVRGPTVLNVCELAQRGPLVLGLLATRSGGCIAGLGGLGELRRRHRGLQVAVVAIGGGLEELRGIVRRRNWSFPVGWDRDGVLASLYGVAACPYVVVARWRGRVQATLLGTAVRDELDGEAARAIAASRRAGWRP